MEFENDPRNPGVCEFCAHKLLTIMRDHKPTWAAMDRQEHDQRVAESLATKDYRSKVERLARGSTDPGWIYYVEQGDLIKIGYSVKPLNRMKAYGPTATLMAIHPGTPALEKEMHQRFRRYLARGREWFSRDAVLMTHIATVREKFGDPSVFAYAYTIPPEKRDTPTGNSAARFTMIR